MFYSEKSHKILEIRLILSFLFIICAFIQVGGQGQIISVSFAAYLMIWIYLGFDKLKPEDMTIPFLLMALSTFEFWNNDAIFLFILRALREYSVLILYISSRHFNKPINNSKSWAKAAIYFQYLCIGFSLLQLVSIVIGQPAFFLPYEWYGNISGDEIFSSESRITTVPSYWIEFGFQRSFVLGEEYKLRPVAFYTEPSYLASILLIIAFFVQSICFDNIKIIRYAYFLCLIG